MVYRAAVLSGPSDEVEARVLEGLEVPRAVGDLLFLFPALKEVGRSRVDASIERLAEAGLVRRVGNRLWELTESGSRWLDEQAEWQIRVAEVVESTARGPMLTGTLDRGVVKVGDWFHNGVGNTGRVVAVDRFDPDSRSVSIGFEGAAGLSAPGVLRRWTPLAGDVDEAVLSPPAWDADMFGEDLLLDGSLPDISARFAQGRSWQDVHSLLARSGLRWEIWRGSAQLSELPPLDEVFAGLTVGEIEQISHLLAEKRKEGLTYIIVSHDLRALEPLVDRAVAMTFGTAIAEGSFTEVMGDEAVRAAYLGQ